MDKNAVVQFEENCGVILKGTALPIVVLCRTIILKGTPLPIMVSCGPITHPD